ncbi:MAG: hypothetical protein JNL14_16060 [Devosia sp.]|uniref:hypothetical protein n=1 Tax=Devosia sp. TaxID=1871048 RepID=UPI001A407A99|nr:hypothetical protein [Devosia sp.]MBL8599248.1 hypothetical protein [Devosia sp.]
MTISIIWAAGTRSGSEFAVTLTEAAFRPKLLEEIKVSAARESFVKETRTHAPITFDEALVLGRTADAIKIEEPTIDDWLDRFLQAYPCAKIIGTYRPLERVIRSHQRLKDSWGFHEDRVVSLFEDRLRLYERLALTGAFFLIPIEEPKDFCSGAFLDFLGVEATLEFQDHVARWPVINDTQHLLTLSQYAGYSVPSEASSSQVARPNVKRRYEELVRESNRPRNASA